MGTSPAFAEAASRRQAAEQKIPSLCSPCLCVVKNLFGQEYSRYAVRPTLSNFTNVSKLLVNVHFHSYCLNNQDWLHLI